MSLLAVRIACGDETVDVAEQLRHLQQQNRQLQEQLNKQQQLIESLMQKVSEVETAGQKREDELRSLKAEMSGSPVPVSEPSKPFSFGKIILSGEGGVAFLESGSEGQYPDAAFRVDEAKLFLDAQVFDDVYFYAELNIAEHESNNENTRVGELYVDFENVSRFWNQPRLLNVRVGRFDTPFGEEYLTRDAIDNPLISHSLSDIWAEDEGIEIYGSLGKFDYVFAVQNGGIPSLNDYDADKALVGRVGFTPAKWLRLSASAMRTGELNANQDALSALWFGNGFIRALGPAATEFHADLIEGDVAFRMPRGHLKAWGGYLRSDDNDPSADDKRNVYYYAIEGMYSLTPKFYGVARFSQILAADGYPIVGNGDFGEFFFGALTTDLWRLSLGSGYRWSPNLLLKVEYSFEQGEEVGGEARDHEDQFGVELAFQF